MSREIEIICEEDQPRYFEISEGSISLNMLKSYYPNITGLSYTKSGKSLCLFFGSNAVLQLDPEISQYIAIYKHQIGIFKDIS